MFVTVLLEYTAYLLYGLAYSSTIFIGLCTAICPYVSLKVVYIIISYFDIIEVIVDHHNIDDIVKTTCLHKQP